MLNSKTLFIQTVLNVPINQSFTYKIPDELTEEIAVGKRVEVRFGNRRMTAYVLSISTELPKNLPITEDKIKPILKILDKDVIFTEEQIALSNWMAKYYLCSTGEALATIIPSGRRESEIPSFSFPEDESVFEKKFELSQEQKNAANEIIHQKKQLHYLYGPTGTGKTEVFLEAAEKLLTQGKGVIYLVPEIGLTHQVVEAVVNRFGQTAAVLHSELSPSQRLKEWHRIINKEARVVIGARSGVFAPVPDLGLIIIDEEHDGSYKSGNTPRYHARQVAMYRCATLGIPLVMGSATPSVEAWYLMESGKIQRHVLSKRLAGGKTPEIQIVDLSKTDTADGCLSPLLCDEIRNTLAEKRQTILFLNRRGFTHFFRCNTCNYELKCKNCSVPLTFHKSEKRLRCHYCGWVIEPPSLCPECTSMDVGYSGFGTEFIEAEVEAKFPGARISRIDTDSLSKKGELQEKLEDFKSGKIDILLGTQMVAKGLNFPNLKLVGVVLADTGLHMPDFRASERTFALITQVAGRAGRFFPDGKVIVQSFSPEEEAIAYACSNSTEDFYQQELQQRQLLGFPPFSRMLRLVFRSANEKESKKAAKDAAQIISIETKKMKLELDILGPSECPIYKIAANFRWQILLRAISPTPLQQVCSRFLYGYKSPTNVYIEVDMDPVSLL
ncbi:MAG: primosomal protein N' [Spirochaetaceae bacterium]|nr:primosomal protein N' [Spirochaetaceae bacterium]